MALGTDFLLDDTGDIDMTNGASTQAVSVIQTVAKALRLIKGEWFADQSVGVPYFEDVWVKNPVMEHLEQVFKTAILEIEEVNTVLSLDLDYNADTRTLTVTFECDTIEGVISDSVVI